MEKQKVKITAGVFPFMNDLDELQNFDPEQQPVVIRRKKSGLFGKVVALLLGLLFGIAATVGGIVGFGWYVYSKAPIKDSIGTVNNLLGTDINYAEYIDSSYGNKTLETLLGDVLDATAIVADGKGSLNTLSTISPLVKQLVLGDGTEADQGLIGLMNSYAIYPDADALMSKILVKPEGTPENENNENIYFVDYIKSCVNNASLGDMMQALGYELNDVVTTLCYGEENVDYVYENGAIKMINGATKTTLKEFLGDDLNEQIQQLPVDSFITVNFPDDAVMCMLAYGAEYRYEKSLDSAGNVVMRQVFYTGEGDPFLLTDDEGNDVTADIVSGADDPTNGIVLHYTYTENDTEITETRYLQYNETDSKYYAFEDEACTSPIRFKKNTIGILSEDSNGLINSMYIKDLLNVTPTSDSVLIAIAYGQKGTDWTLDENNEFQMLNGAKPRTVADLENGEIFNTLTLRDLLGDDVDGNVILSKLADTTIEGLPDAMEELTFDDIFSEKIYEDLDNDPDTAPTVKPMWSYLFDDPLTSDTEGPKDYYILGGTNESTAEKKGVDAMVDNMQKNMQNATLGKLVSDDLIVFDNDEDGQKKNTFLTDTEQTKISVDGELKYVRDVTIIQMINYLIS